MFYVFSCSVVLYVRSLSWVPSQSGVLEVCYINSWDLYSLPSSTHLFTFSHSFYFISLFYDENLCLYNSFIYLKDIVFLYFSTFNFWVRILFHVLSTYLLITWVCPSKLPFPNSSLLSGHRPRFSVLYLVPSLIIFLIVRRYFSFFWLVFFKSLIPLKNLVVKNFGRNDHEPSNHSTSSLLPLILNHLSLSQLRKSSSQRVGIVNEISRTLNYISPYRSVRPCHHWQYSFFTQERLWILSSVPYSVSRSVPSLPYPVLLLCHSSSVPVLGTTPKKPFLINSVPSVRTLTGQTWWPRPKVGVPEPDHQTIDWDPTVPSTYYRVTHFRVVTFTTPISETPQHPSRRSQSFRGPTVS